MFCFKQWLILLAILYAVFAVSATQNRFVVLTAAQDPKERHNDYNCKDYLGASVNDAHDVSFRHFLKDIDCSGKFSFDYLIDHDLRTRYSISTIMESKLLVLMSSYAKCAWSERKFECKSSKECTDEEWDYIHEDRRRSLGHEFKISPSKKEYFSYPFTLKTHLIQRGFLDAPNDVMSAFEFLSSDTFQEGARCSLLEMSEQEMSTSIIGVYDIRTGRIFVYDFEHDATYVLLPLGIMNDLVKYGLSKYGYVSIGIYGVPTYSCWCDLYPNTHVHSARENAEQVIMDFFSSFSLRENVVSDSVQVPCAGVKD